MELMLKKANNLKSNDPYITDSLGWALYKLKNYKEPNSRVPNQQILSICLNGITYGYILYHWKEENNPHRNSVVVAVYRGHDFFKSGSKVRAKIQGKCTVTFR